MIKSRLESKLRPSRFNRLSLVNSLFQQISSLAEYVRRNNRKQKRESWRFGKKNWTKPDSRALPFEVQTYYEIISNNEAIPIAGFSNNSSFLQILGKRSRVHRLFWTDLREIMFSWQPFSCCSLHQKKRSL